MPTEAEIYAAMTSGLPGPNSPPRPSSFQVDMKRLGELHAARGQVFYQPAPIYWRIPAAAVAPTPPPRGGPACPVCATQYTIKPGGVRVCLCPRN